MWKERFAEAFYANRSAVVVRKKKLNKWCRNVCSNQKKKVGEVAT
jgi:hypothetical protein